MRSNPSIEGDVLGLSPLSAPSCQTLCAKVAVPMKDEHGVEVEIGDFVRVLEIDEGFLKMLPDDERQMHEAMRFKEYVVDDIVEGATKASVSFWQ